MIRDGKDIGGRPSSYSDELPDLVIKSMMMGLKGARLFAILGISRAVFYKYLKQHPELDEAYERGKELAEAWWDNKGIEYMEDGAKDKFHYWKTLVDRNFGATPGQQGNQINIGQMNVQIKSPEEYQRMLLDVRQQAKVLNILTVDAEDENDGTEPGTD